MLTILSVLATIFGAASTALFFLYQKAREELVKVKAEKDTEFVKLVTQIKTLEKQNETLAKATKHSATGSLDVDSLFKGGF